MRSPLEGFMVAEKHRYKTAASFVAGTLREGILNGTLAEGTVLRQDELAEKFSLSRMPIRDALRQLESGGLVVYEPHKGAVVATMAIDDIVEIFDMRVMSECTALKMAFPHLSREILSTLDTVIKEMDGTKNPNALSELNRRFHMTLYKEAKRARLQALINSLHDSIDRYLRFLLVSLEYHKMSQREHRSILEACIAKDQKAAVDLLKKHLLSGKDEVVDFVTSRAARGNFEKVV